jgi:hypothetical protein
LAAILAMSLVVFQRGALMEGWTDAELREVVMEVTRRATVDPVFRQLAITDGQRAIATVSPKPLPPGIEFRFVDNSGRVKTVPLPDAVCEIFTDELTDEELDQVAGGTPPFNVDPPTGG